MRIVIATCAARYSGRLGALLPLAKRLILLKADGSVLLHSDGGSYKPLNWMSPPCRLQVLVPDGEAAARGVSEVWAVVATKNDSRLEIDIHEVIHDYSVDLGPDPGVTKDGVEAQLQELLAARLDLLGAGHALVRREYPTAIGPVDILARRPGGGHVAVEIKRRGEIDGVDQLTRYLELLNRDPLLAPVHGVFAAQEVRPQARVLAQDRGISVLTLDYHELRGQDDGQDRLF